MLSNIRAPHWRPFAMGALLFVSLGVPATGNVHRQQGAHLHGHGSLDVVVEGGELVLELRIPAVNVVGFEHEPNTDEQRRAVNNALAVFRQGTKLFMPSGAARCELERVEVSLAGGAHHEGEEGHEHGKREEREQPEDEKHKEHEQEVHSELHGEYHFHCEAPERLERLQLHLFAHLRDADELKARVVTATLQTEVELRPDGETVLELTR